MFNKESQTFILSETNPCGLPEEKSNTNPLNIRKFKLENIWTEF